MRIAALLSSIPISETRKTLDHYGDQHRCGKCLQAENTDDVFSCVEICPRSTDTVQSN